MLPQGKLKGLVRRVAQFGLAVSLLLTFLVSPFAHRHAAESHLHAALGQHDHHAHEADELAWLDHDDDDDAVYGDWLAGDGSSTATKMTADLPAARHAFGLSAMAVAALRPSPRNHDPPSQAPPKDRAPPV